LRKIGIIAVLSLIIAALAAVPALAANPHTLPGEPITCNLVQGGTAVTCSGELAGLGNVDFVDVTVDIAAGCATRGNQSQPRGHVQETDEDIPVNRNGRATFNVGPVGPDCPGGLNEVIGQNALIIVTNSETGKELFRTTVPIQS
jgi:hypothetical protein